MVTDQSDDYRVRVYAPDAYKTGLYSLTAAAVPADGDDCGSGIDAGSTFATGIDVTLPLVCDGELGPGDDSDHMRFDVPAKTWTTECADQTARQSST